MGASPRQLQQGGGGALAALAGQPRRRAPGPQGPDVGQVQQGWGQGAAQHVQRQGRQRQHGKGEAQGQGARGSGRCRGVQAAQPKAPGHHKAHHGEGVGEEGGRHAQHARRQQGAQQHKQRHAPAKALLDGRVQVRLRRGANERQHDAHAVVHGDLVVAMEPAQQEPQHGIQPPIAIGAELEAHIVLPCLHAAAVQHVVHGLPVIVRLVRVAVPLRGHKVRPQHAHQHQHQRAQVRVRRRGQEGGQVRQGKAGRGGGANGTRRRSGRGGGALAARAAAHKGGVPRILLHSCVLRAAQGWAAAARWARWRWLWHHAQASCPPPGGALFGAQEGGR